MDEKIAKQQEGESSDDRQIAPVPCGGDLAPDEAKEGNGEAEIEESRGIRANPHRHEHAGPAADPQQRPACEAHTL